MGVEEQRLLPDFSIGNSKPKQVGNFRYLGAEVNQMICAAAAFGKLQPRVFYSYDLKLSTILFSKMFCTRQKWGVLNRNRIRTLNKFHLQWLRNIMNIIWSDRVRDASILRLAKVLSYRPTWRGINWDDVDMCLKDSRNVSSVLNSKNTRKRKHGWQLLRFKDVQNRHMKKEEQAQNRPKWTRMQRQVQIFKDRRRSELDQKRDELKARPPTVIMSSI